ncbi:MAG TPA: thioredoxin family protein [Planctomycetaceae bacterium]|nr:thioredoxin family protein [Planctomycetaceae bacterium]
MKTKNTLWTRTTIVLALAGTLMLGSLALAEQHEKQRDFTLKDQDGKSVSLKDFKGKVVVLEWINCDCPFVKGHHGDKTMQRLADKWSKKKVVWLAINSTHYQTSERDREHREKYGLPYPILSDSSGEVGKLFHAMTTPHVFVLDKKGKVVYQGAIDDDPDGKKRREGKALNYVDQALTEHFAGKKPSVPKTHPYGCSVKYRPSP